ncbi:hypothetical protein ZWY2020_047895 [Hordeum vulgare]|nr:hypothetical protein ZWY2020_047895 [Hordeum vulgare]
MASAGDVFDHGRHGTSLARVEQAKNTRCSAASRVDADSQQSPPKPLLVAAPCDAGEYPVVVFLHGYLCNNYFYSQLIQHVASHGFIVVCPQLYTVSGPDTTGEINSAAAVIDWLAAGLSSKLAPGIRPNLAAVSISGHSRGGKVAFALGLGHAKTSLPLAALIAVDPWTAPASGNQTPPPILAYKPNAIRVPAPVMVIGTGLGELPRNALFRPARRWGQPRGILRRVRGAGVPPRGQGLQPHRHDGRRDDGRQGLATRALCKTAGPGRP